MPRPQTQIPLSVDEFGDLIIYLDMGWEDVKVAVEYDGEQHRSDRRQYTWDIRRLKCLSAWVGSLSGWSLATGRPTSSAGFGRPLRAERHSSVTVEAERHASATLGGGS